MSARVCKCECDGGWGGGVDEPLVEGRVSKFSAPRMVHRCGVGKGCLCLTSPALYNLCLGYGEEVLPPSHRPLPFAKGRPTPLLVYLDGGWCARPPT